MPDLSEPIDPVHFHSMEAVRRIRERVLDAKMKAAKWEPKPMPEWWDG